MPRRGSTSNCECHDWWLPRPLAIQRVPGISGLSPPAVRRPASSSLAAQLLQLEGPPGPDDSGPLSESRLTAAASGMAGASAASGASVHTSVVTAGCRPVRMRARVAFFFRLALMVLDFKFGRVINLNLT